MQPGCPAARTSKSSLTTCRSNSYGQFEERFREWDSGNIELLERLAPSFVADYRFAEEPVELFETRTAGAFTDRFARIMGTSVAQIDATYGHLLPDSEDYLRGLLDAYDDVYGLSGPGGRLDVRNRCKSEECG